CDALAPAEDHSHAPEVEARTVFQLLANAGGEALAVQLGVVGRLQVFHEVVAADVQQASVAPGYAAVFSSIWGQIDVGEDAAARVLAAHGDLLLLRKGQFSAGGDDHQAGHVGVSALGG